jgi:hypothetical protein
VYDAALFKQRIGRDPEPAELANFKAMKGVGWAGDPTQGKFTVGQAAVGAGETALTAGTGALATIPTAGAYLYGLTGAGGTDSLSAARATRKALTYSPRTEAGQAGIETLGQIKPGEIVPRLLDVSGNPNAAETVREIEERAGDVAPLAAEGLSGFAGTRALGNRVVSSMRDAEGETAPNIPTGSPQSISAAAASSPALAVTSPELQSAVANAKNVNTDALQRHINAETLPQPEGVTPLRLRAGQATRDDQQLSDELNMRADETAGPILRDSINDQNSKLGSSMGEIRRRANPDIVQRTTPENAQAAIDAIKTQDNAAILDTRAKYKALADANGGTVPLDASSAMQGIQNDLNKGFLNRTARENPVVGDVLNRLENNSSMSFEEFENARSNLAEVQRQGGPAAKAAAIVRNRLESMPLSPQASQLKGLADTARAAAKARFDTIEQNPAYEAVVNDNVPKTPDGLHRVGTPSPLADTFMDRYLLGNGANASRAYVGRLQGVMQGSSDFAPAVEASALNKLRDSAGLSPYDEGNFQHAGYRKTRNAMEGKADVLMSPQSADWTNQLKDASDDVGYAGKASSINRSNTALTLRRFGAQYPEPPKGIGPHLADYGAEVLAAQLGPVGTLAKKFGVESWNNAKLRRAEQSIKDAKLKFAQDATKPGAGIEAQTLPTTSRATGGKVDHEALLGRLMSRWHAARKASSHETEPLLKFPDAAIIRALDIAQRRI